MTVLAIGTGVNTLALVVFAVVLSVTLVITYWASKRTSTATEFWATGGLPLEHLPKEIVMSAENMVDAALVGFDRGELVTIPSLHPEHEWEAFEAARKTLSSHHSSNTPAARYLKSA